MLPMLANLVVFFLLKPPLNIVFLRQCLHYGPVFRTLVRIRTFLGKVVRKWSGFTVKVRILSSWESKPPGSCYFCSQLRSTGTAHNYIITTSSTVFSVISLKYIQFEQEKATMIQSKSNYLPKSGFGPDFMEVVWKNVKSGPDLVWFS